MLSQADITVLYLKEKTVTEQIAFLKYVASNVFIDIYVPKEEVKPEHYPEDKPKKDILQTAHDIIYGDREKTYGHPAKNLEVIAEFWNTYLKGIAINDNQGLHAEDVCVMMTLLKLARLKNTPDHKDTQVDACGYMALMERVQDFVPPVSDSSDGTKN